MIARVRSLSLALSAAGLTLVSGDAWAGLSCDDIMNMADHNVPASVIVDTIDGSGTVFTDADIQCLKQRGAPAAVLAKALELKAPSPSSSRAAASEDEEPAPRSRFEDEEALGGGDLLSGDDASEEEGETSGADDLDKYIKLYKAKRYKEAAFYLYKLIEENAYPDKLPTVQYYLAKSLQANEMYHSAQHYYMEVVKKGPRNPLFKHALPRLAQIATYTGNDTELLRIVDKIAPEAYPRQARPHLSYLMGRKAMEGEQYAEAAAFFEKVPPGHELYPRAQYFQGYINWERQKFKSAVKAFREVIRAEIPTDDPKLVKELEDLKDLALINVARIYYGLQKYDNADAYYAKVDRDSIYWPQALFERAWTNFFLGDYNESLGLILTLQSPFFADQDFLPEAEYLRALLYFQFCEYKDVERIVKLAQSRYQPMRGELTDLLQRYMTDEGKQLLDQAFDDYFGSRATADSKLPVSLFKKVLRDRELSALVRHMDLLRAESDLIAQSAPQWRDTIGEHLGKILAADELRYKKRAGLAFVKAMQEQRTTLTELLEDTDIVLFELADAQRADYMFKMSAPAVDPTDEQPVDFATSQDIIYWPFNGEFWRDELAYYRFTERGSCK